MDFAASLRSMEIQSATTIAVKSLKHLDTFSGENGFGKKFDNECKRLLEARPTAVVLRNAIDQAKTEGIQKTIRFLEASKDSSAKNASHIFKKKSLVLTHCHSTFVVAAITRNKSRVKEVIVTETRPRDQGLMTARDLIRKNIPVSYIIDSAIGNFMGKCDMIIVGADALRREGLVNKVGTYPLAVFAKESKKPLYVITSTFSEDNRKKFLMEQRPASEVMHQHLKGARIFNPAFDVTPWKYVTAVVTEKGIIKPKNLIRSL